MDAKSPKCAKESLEVNANEVDLVAITVKRNTVVIQARKVPVHVKESLEANAKEADLVAIVDILCTEML
jgi:hypothetical protein